MFSADPGSKAVGREQLDHDKPDTSENLEQAYVGLVSLGTMSVAVLELTVDRAVSHCYRWTGRPVNPVPSWCPGSSSQVS